MSGWTGPPEGTTNNPDGASSGVDQSAECPRCGAHVADLSAHLRSQPSDVERSPIEPRDVWEALGRTMRDDGCDPLPLAGGYTAQQISRHSQYAWSSLRKHLGRTDGIVQVWGIRGPSHRPVETYLPDDHPRVQQPGEVVEI